MKYLSAAAITLVACASPAHATTEDMLAAALKRIEALESKTDRLAEENKQLRSQLHKTSEIPPKEQVKYTHTKIAVSAPASAMPNALPSIPVYQAQEQGSNWHGIYAGFNVGYGKNNVPINRRSVGSGYYSNDSNTTYGEGPLAGGQRS